MSTWNYRVLERTDQKTGDKTYAIHEVYYNDEGKADGCTEDSVAPMGESLQELNDDMDHYRQALGKPILIYDSLEEARGIDGSRGGCQVVFSLLGKAEKVVVVVAGKR